MQEAAISRLGVREGLALQTPDYFRLHTALAVDSNRRGGFHGDVSRA